MTAIALPSRPAVARVLLVPVFACATWVLAKDVLLGKLLLPTLLVAAIGAVLVLTKTREMCIVWLILVGSLLPPRLVPLSFGGIRTDGPELLGLALIGAVVARSAMGERFRPAAFTGPLVALVGAAGFGSVIASINGADHTSWLALLKNFMLFLVPLAFSWLFVTPEQRDQLEVWIHRICTVGGLLVLASAAAGRGVPAGETPEVVTLGVASEALRLRPALLTLTILATLLLAARTSLVGARRIDVFRFAVYAAVVAVSFTRSTWVPLTLALVLLSLFRPGRRVPLRGLRTVLVVAVVGFVTFTLASNGTLGSTPKAITLRIESIGSNKVLDENSYLDRRTETILAEQTLSQHPLTGVGLGQPYGAVRRVYDPVSGRRSLEPRRFIHNSYLGYWLWAGLPGLLAMIWLAVRTAVVTRRSKRELPAFDGARAVAAGLAVLALGLQASFQTSLTSRPVIATLACAVVFLDVRRESPSPIPARIPAQLQAQT
jgi:O-antigen ligase